MKKHSISDTDIVDTILAQAEPLAKEAVRNDRKDPDFDAAYNEWTRILASAKSEAQRIEKSTQRVNTSVMASIRQEKLLESNSMSKESGLSAPWLLRVRWRGILVPLAPALVICLLIAMAALQLFPAEVSSPMSTPVANVDSSTSDAAESGTETSSFNTAAVQLSPVEVASPVKTSVTYVDFSVSEAAEGGTETSPFNTLEEAIQATGQGGTILIRPTAGYVSLRETVRITTPLHIQTQNVGD